MNKVKQPEFPIEITIEITQQLEVHSHFFVWRVVVAELSLSWQSWPGCDMHKIKWSE
jgi:hypothetical protein